MTDTIKGNLIIRNACPDDLAACTRIEQASFSPEEAAEPESIRKRIATFAEGFLVAERHGTIIGQINSGATNKDDITNEAFKQLIGHEKDGENLVIFSLSVLPDKRRLGIASRLMERFIRDAKRQKRAAILLLCKEELIPYYTRFRFEDRGLSTSTHGNAQWHEMALSLDKVLPTEM